MRPHKKDASAPSVCAEGALVFSVQAGRFSEPQWSVILAGPKAPGNPGNFYPVAMPGGWGTQTPAAQAPCADSQDTSDKQLRYTLKRKCMTSPSLTTYSLPSTRSTPLARQAASFSWLM